MSLGRVLKTGAWVVLIWIERQVDSTLLLDAPKAESEGTMSERHLTVAIGSWGIAIVAISASASITSVAPPASIGAVLPATSVDTRRLGGVVLSIDLGEIGVDVAQVGEETLVQFGGFSGQLTGEVAAFFEVVRQVEEFVLAGLVIMEKLVVAYDDG